MSGAKLPHMLWLMACFDGGALYMANEWIIDVLADLRSYARASGMEATAASLEDAALVALAEAGSSPRRAAVGEQPVIHVGHGGEKGNVTWLFAGRELA